MCMYHIHHIDISAICVRSHSHFMFMTWHIHQMVVMKAAKQHACSILQYESVFQSLYESHLFKESSGKIPAASVAKINRSF